MLHICSVCVSPCTCKYRNGKVMGGGGWEMTDAKVVSLYVRFPPPHFLFSPILANTCCEAKGVNEWKVRSSCSILTWLRIEWHFLRAPKLIVLLPREGHLFISACSCAASKVLCTFHFSLVLFFFKFFYFKFYGDPSWWWWYQVLALMQQHSQEKLKG